MWLHAEGVSLKRSADVHYGLILLIIVRTNITLLILPSLP